jgi:RNA polymerase sigma-70 factor (ECF subfamily)
MPSRSSADTDEVLRQARAGNPRAVEELLERNRPKLRQMIAVRIDPRLAGRLDPSDVVQDTLAEAAEKMSDYLRRRPLPFYLWLRHLAWQRLVDLHRQHIQARKRSVTREEPLGMAISDRSAMQLAGRLSSGHSSPSQSLMRRERRQRVRDALERLSESDRELLVLMYLEQLSTAEASAVLGVSERAVTMRHLRALDRLRRILVE